ncbi:nitrite reductase large subunit NirB [Paenibacillus gorillae]|uniref:nitrite reductase large subunit NirB n=1 Tax=Paenibacillus gorillae TaxID=1243662 RepID=UPI0004AFCD5A|nr:nitrite reductase large subunit NirB [Paenibacillus gorillae]
MGKEKLVVIGNGMAGVKCVEHIHDQAPDAFDIAIIGNEPHPNYNRIELSKVLQGDAHIDRITLNDWDWYKERGIRLFAGETAVKADTANRLVVTNSGLTLPYDKLIFATGSSAFMPQLPGIDKEGVTAFRTLADCRTMLRAAAKYKRAAVIGGGLLGLEAARGLLNLGMEVTVVHNASYLMNRQLDTAAAELLQQELTEQGMRFLLGKRTERIIGRKRAEGLQFTDGGRLAADLIVLAIGISPNILAAEASGITVNRAIIVNDYLETSVPDVYAVGECAEHRSTVYGLVAPLYEQGKVLAARLCKAATKPYEGSVPYAQLKVAGVEVFSVGLIREEEAETALQRYNGLNKTYQKITMRDGKVAGAVLYGDSTEGMKLLDLVKRSASVQDLQPLESSSGTEQSGLDKAAAMPEGETVCACNGVSKGVIVEAVCSFGLKTVEQVREKTKASGSCGGCKPVVKLLLDYAVAGGGERIKAGPPICDCTPLDHSAVKEAVEKQGHHDWAAAMRSLGWLNAEGCSICRRTLRYYAEKRSGRNAHTLWGPSGSSKAGFSRDHTPIGNALEEGLRGIPMPAEVQIAISAGPAFPAGVMVHDFGIRGVPAGWEIYVGGYGENPVKQGTLLSIEATGAAAILTMLGCVQIYRETAHYGERPWKWLDRYGLQRIREAVLDGEECEQLYARLSGARLPLPVSANS